MSAPVLLELSQLGLHLRLGQRGIELCLSAETSQTSISCICSFRTLGLASRMQALSAETCLSFGIWSVYLVLSLLPCRHQIHLASTLLIELGLEALHQVIQLPHLL